MGRIEERWTGYYLHTSLKVEVLGISYGRVGAVANVGSKTLEGLLLNTIYVYLNSKS